MADIVIHHGRQLIHRCGPSRYQMAAGIVLTEQDLGQGGTFVL